MDPATSIDDALLLAFIALADQVPGVLGLAWVDASGPHTLGALQAEPVWSTIKVPVAIAGLRAADDARMNTLVDSAITVSDNASSYAIWDRLGAGDVAADAVAGYAPGGLLDPWDLDLLAEEGITPDLFPERVWDKGTSDGTFVTGVHGSPTATWAGASVTQPPMQVAPGVTLAALTDADGNTIGIITG